jgi:hypothetical protein
VRKSKSKKNPTKISYTPKLATVEEAFLSKGFCQRADLDRNRSSLGVTFLDVELSSPHRRLPKYSSKSLVWFPLHSFRVVVTLSVSQSVMTILVVVVDDEEPQLPVCAMIQAKVNPHQTQHSTTEFYHYPRSSVKKINGVVVVVVVVVGRAVGWKEFLM